MPRSARAGNVVISASGRHQQITREALEIALLEELQHAVGPLPALKWSQLITEKRATFACTPGLTRPGNATPDPRLWLAGDYTASPSPATLEAAIQSGTTAARSGQPLAWAKGCVQLGYAVEGTAAIPGDQERAVIEAVIAHWNQRIGGCAYQHLVSLGPIDREVSGRDFVSVIKFRDATWCRPAVDGKPMKCHSHAAAGVTTAVYVNEPGDPRDGELVDADVELNGVDFAIAVDGQSSGPAGCQADLANTLTHELGHVLGLEHTCLTPADAPHLDDDWLTLSTIHSAKGLEWSAVHVIHAADGNIPSDMALADKAGLDPRSVTVRGNDGDWSALLDLLKLALGQGGGARRSFM